MIGYEQQDSCAGMISTLAMLERSAFEFTEIPVSHMLIDIWKKDHLTDVQIVVFMGFLVPIGFYAGSRKKKIVF